MRRRKFITLLGGAVAAWPRVARAQQPTMPVVGCVYYGPPEANANSAAAFRKGLSQAGYVEGRNVAIEFRFAHNELARLPELVTDLVRHRVAVIATPNSATVAVAAKAVTTTTPIVFSTGGDPVQLGLVASLNRPGGNVTGFSSLVQEDSGKQLGLLHDLLPRAARFAVLANPSSPNFEPSIKGVQAAAAAIGRQTEIFLASTNGEIDTAFESLVQKRPDALLVSPSLLYNSRRSQLLTLAAHHRLPTMYGTRDFTDAGGLMSYSSDLQGQDAARQVGIYVARILNGEKPADLPVQLATKFAFVINLQTAKTLGITIPPMLLALADAVIE
jgi:ABC-type uncharacterized transport system substrate-binding protein